ncbi:MAG TPA: DNA repair protein RecN [Solirubrobacteraceae bacterium]|jgi:DNA repair protein RecN (Recombination protein N)|nr:DNA repair protein RecN [Solirubrobacteraceae bacterium]
MLCELRVQNLLLIERAELQFADGLNVLTGETGAGKTVLAQALDLLMGSRPPGTPAGRSKARIVRPGAETAYVEGVFAVPDGMQAEIQALLPEALRDEAGQGELVLARRIDADGRTRAFVGGRSASVADLRELGARLISFYGQHEHRKLVLAATQLQTLDAVCGEAHSERLHACAASYRETLRLEAELARLAELEQARERELGLLEYELAEIDEAGPDPEEYAALVARRERLRGIEVLRMAAAEAAEALAPESGEGIGAAHMLAGAARELQAPVGVDAELDALAARAQTLSIEADDLAGAIRSYLDGIDTGIGPPTRAHGGEEGSLQAVEERLAAIERLMRKHGGTIDAVLEYATRSRARADELGGAEQAQDQARELLEHERATLEDHVSELRVGRKDAATRLTAAVREQLTALAMPDASFAIELRGTEVRGSGADAVEFMIAPNPGVAAAPLREIASGGELSRVMLALASACEQAAGSQAHAQGSTLVFDEVDAGIGGHTARAVGERLQALARGRQLICITHLPQIASLADRHFSIRKDTSTDLTLASVTRLTEREVEGELVRMLGAQESDAGARKHARELRRAA